VLVRAFLYVRRLRSVSIRAKTAVRAAAGRVTNHFQRQFERSTANRKPFSSASRRLRLFRTEADFTAFKGVAPNGTGTHLPLPRPTVKESDGQFLRDSSEMIPDPNGTNGSHN
jgi:hypothetical protein